MQCWIYEHFPHICDLRIQRMAARDPRAKRWKARQTHPGDVTEYSDRRTLSSMNRETASAQSYRVVLKRYRTHRDYKSLYCYPKLRYTAKANNSFSFWFKEK